MLFKKSLVSILTFTSIFAFGQVPESIQTIATQPFVLGVSEEIHSKLLEENRILNIYLPEGYKQEEATRYPVIYLLDGSADEDFIHVVGLVHYNSFSWVDRLPKSIVVGIANIDRRRDFTFPTTIEDDKRLYPSTGASDKFISFIESELQPYIDRKYKTNTSKTIIGQSLGGLLATEILFKRPHLFEKYIIISPSLWWDNGSLLDVQPEIPEEGFYHQTDIYIGVGKEGKAPGNSTHIMEEDAKLLSNKIREMKINNVNVYFDYLPQEDHATVAHQAILNAFRLLSKQK